MEKQVENVIQQLRDEGYRLTPQRLAILEAISADHSHPTAEEVHQQVSADQPTLSLATVYKTLHILEELGAVTELQVGGSSHYESAPQLHPHLICVECHTIIDLPPDTMMPLSEEVLDDVGFHPQRYEVNVYGLCSQCQ